MYVGKEFTLRRAQGELDYNFLRSGGLPLFLQSLAMTSFESLRMIGLLCSPEMTESLIDVLTLFYFRRVGVLELVTGEAP